MIIGYVKGQALKAPVGLVVSDTIDYLEAKFVFQTSDWDGLSKWAHFTQGEKTYDILLTDDKIRREDHLNLSAGEWSVYLHGVSSDGMRITTAEQKFKVEKTGVLKGQPLPEVPATPAEQIAAQAQRAEDKATEALTEVKKVAPLAEAAKTSADAAAKSAVSADNAARSAGDFALDAQRSEQNAQRYEQSAGIFAGQVNQDKNAVDQMVDDAQEIAKGINLDVVKNGEIANQIGKDALQVKNDASEAVSAKEVSLKVQSRVESLERSAQTAKNQAETAAGNAKSEADRATNNILNGVDNHNKDHSSHPFLLSEVSRVESIAKGRNFAKVFPTKDAMGTWLLDPENVKTLEVGTNLYIEDLNVPDYWWDGTQAKELEVEHPDLSGYATKVELSMSLPMTIEETEYKKLEDAGQLVPGRIYYVVPDGTIPKVV